MVSITKILYFNIAMVILFMISSIYVGNFISTQINDIQGFNGQGLVTIPYIETYGFTISISHIIYYENGTVANLGPLPTTIPNYPVFLFLITIFVDAYFVVKVRSRQRVALQN